MLCVIPRNRWPGLGGPCGTSHAGISGPLTNCGWSEDDWAPTWSVPKIGGQAPVAVEAGVAERDGCSLDGGSGGEEGENEGVLIPLLLYSMDKMFWFFFMHVMCLHMNLEKSEHLII